MADTKITNLTSAAASTGDELVVCTTGLTDRKVRAESIANLANNLGPTTIAGIRVTTALIAPNTNDGVAIGTTANAFSDLFLAAGGVIQFSTAPISITAGTSILTIVASTLITNGVSQSTAAIYPTTSEGVTLGTSTNRWAGVFTSSGINFPAAVDASADANTLDDYEEGTYSPTFTPATTGTYTNGVAAGNTGNYVKVGAMVFVSGLLSVTTHTSGTGTGQMGISMPFASRADGAANLNISRMTSTGGRGARMAVLTTGAAIARIFLSPVASTGATSALNLADISTAAQNFDFSGVYSV